ncbi:uncharacterized protein [Elaeis guineensis]|uniref:Uncharacterized protein LOC105053829 n=1 Tax=Elaeis guineensis var. tenera TaxID=51953 RepID=A0A6I9S4T2_ELAGV|nr:uncharacterized protein LOC105053829 [Elaeis guineensis]
MQRQSLGAPGAKLQVNGNGGGGEREERRKSAAGVAAAAVAVEEDIKVEKLIRSSSRMERSIHLIPLLTVLCLLLLYLISHDPTPKELEILGGDAHLLFQNAGSATEIGRNIGTGGITAIRSHRGLKEARKIRHRKLGKLFLEQPGDGLARASGGRPGLRT